MILDITALCYPCIATQIGRGSISAHTAFNIWSEIHYLNQCWFIITWTLGNKLKRHFNQVPKLSFQENAFEKVVCDMAANLSCTNVLNQCIDLTHSCQTNWPPYRRRPFQMHFLEMKVLHTSFLITSLVAGQ